MTESLYAYRYSYAGTGFCKAIIDSFLYHDICIVRNPEILEINAIITPISDVCVTIHNVSLKTSLSEDHTAKDISCSSKAEEFFDASIISYSSAEQVE